MERIGKLGAGLAVLACVCSPQPVAGAENDPYAPLKLYDGSWEIKVSEPAAKTDHLVNHCAQTGLFYACEQVVNGKTSALIVFLPIGLTSSGAEQYRTAALVGKWRAWRRMGQPDNQWGQLDLHLG